MRMTFGLIRFSADQASGAEQALNASSKSVRVLRATRFIDASLLLLHWPQRHTPQVHYGDSRLGLRPHRQGVEARLCESEPANFSRHEILEMPRVFHCHL